MREPARWGRRTIATVTAVALAVGVALVASTTGPAAGPPEAAGSGDPAAACRDLRAGLLVACLHGNDAPPPGVSLYERPTLQELEARSSLRSPSPRLRGLAGLEQATSGQAAAEPAAVECIGNGTSGNRIQAIYARAVGTDRYSGLLPSLRQWAAEADQADRLSAGRDRRRQAPALRDRRRLPARGRPGPADDAGRGRLRADADRAAGARLPTAATASTWSGSTPPRGSAAWARSYSW